MTAGLSRRIGIPDLDRSNFGQRLRIEFHLRRGDVFC